MSGLCIESVTDASAAFYAGLAVGDKLLAVNGNRLRDLIDYSYYGAFEDELVFEVEKVDGSSCTITLQCRYGEPVGLTFTAPKPSRCANNCIFCFVHQLPKGLRKPLYVKDEDYRLSFLNGNYVTLANLSLSALNRIIEQRLSPLYISVHTTNATLRERMLGKTGIPPILEQLQKLSDGRIEMHTQVVLCPGINDGDELKRTVTDLVSLYPAVQSLAIVPLGLTEHRHKLPVLTAVSSEYAADFIETWQPETTKIQRKLKQPFLFIADEFYLKSATDFPQIKSYGDFPQLENGVGLVPLFMKEAASVLKRAVAIPHLKGVVVTGVSAFGFVSSYITKLNEICDVGITVKKVENRLFGAAVTVCGLLSGRDIAESLKRDFSGETLFIADVMLKEGEGIFLDDMTLSELGALTGCRVVTFDSTARGFYKCLRAVARHNRSK